MRSTYRSEEISDCDCVRFVERRRGSILSPGGGGEGPADNHQPGVGGTLGGGVSRELKMRGKKRET